MTSDTERREVASKLRGLDEHIDGVPSMCTKQQHDAMALRAIRAVVGKGDIFHLLADLIDVPTTVLDLTETTRTVHGEEVRGWECRECGQSCEEMYGEYEYCPHCRRKVER